MTNRPYLGMYMVLLGRIKCRPSTSSVEQDLILQLESPEGKRLDLTLSWVMKVGSITIVFEPYIR